MSYAMQIIEMSLAACAKGPLADVFVSAALSA